MEPHLAPVGLGEGLARDDLEQEHELEAIAEVLLDVLDLGAGLAEVRVDPRGEGLEESRFWVNEASPWKKKKKRKASKNAS